MLALRQIRPMTETASEPATPTPPQSDGQPQKPAPRPKEVGGPPGPEPTRFGDWERNGRCIDF